MNHIYRSIWSEALNTWIAVSENSKGKAKSSRSGLKNNDCQSLKDWQSCALATGFLLFSPLCWALPTGNQLVAGQATVSNPSAGQMQINQSSQNAIINWQGFSINPNEAVNIQQINAQAALLNRVVGADASVIQGQLKANGQVYLVNPNGVLFSNSAQVDVGGLVASTHNISNTDFMNGNYHFTQDNASGTVSNQGIIKTPEGGVVALIGSQVSNTGTIETPKGTTALAAGKTVDLDFQGNGLMEVKVSEAALNAQIENKGAILADGGRVVLTAKAAGDLMNTVINQEGIIRATSLVERNGEIILEGGTSGVVNVSGTLDASGQNAGGTINVTGKDVNINADANITAQALSSGTAGSIKVLGDMNSGTVSVAGKLDAQAFGTANGGFIETSAAHVNIADSAKITTKAANGNNGEWLIDPYDFTIAASGGDVTGAAINTALGSGNVIIQTLSGSVSCTGVTCGTGNSAGVGDIHVNDTISWTGTNDLTLNAYRNININANISSATNGGVLNLEYGQGAVSTGNTSNYIIGNGAKVSLAAGNNFTTKLGSDGAVTNYTVITDLGIAGDATAAPTTMTLQGMNTGLAGKYVLGADIDATATSSWNSSEGFVPIGNNTTRFTGSFDGLGHTISGLTINRPTTNIVGLFGYTNGATLRNIGMVGGSVSGSNYVGGLVGYNNTSSISNAYSTGSVTGNYYVGGLAGYNYNSSSISNAYATGSVSGSNYVGGLAGHNYSSSISNAYATGSVSGSSSSNYVGGLVGSNNTATINNSFWNTQTSGQPVLGVGNGNLAGVVGKTTAQMQQASTFPTWSISNTGGSSAIWRIYEGNSNPLLRSFLTPLTVGADTITKTYNGLSDSTPSFTNTATGTAITPNANLLGTASYYGTAINVGTYNVSTTGLFSNQQGYDISNGTGTLTIDPATLTYTANAVSRLYGSANPIFDGTVTGLVNNEQLANVTTGILSFNSQTTNNSNVGTYSITGSGLTANNGNYTFTQAAGNSTALSITPANYSQIMGSKAYDGNAVFTNVALTGVNGESFTVVAATANSKDVTTANTFTTADSITGNGGALTSNYILNLASLTGANNLVVITPATLIYTATATSRGFGVDNPTFLGTVSGFKGADSQTNATAGSLLFVSDANRTTTAGSYAIYGSGLSALNGNYVFLQAASNVNALTITPVTAASFSTTELDDLISTLERSTTKLGADKITPTTGLSEEEQFVQDMFNAIFARPIEINGIKFFTDLFESNQSRGISKDFTKKQIAQALSDDPEFVSIYGKLNSRAKFEAVYKNIFRRDPEAGTLNFWVGRLESGALTFIELVLLLIDAHK